MRPGVDALVSVDKLPAFFIKCGLAPVTAAGP